MPTLIHRLQNFVKLWFKAKTPRSVTGQIKCKVISNIEDRNKYFMAFSESVAEKDGMAILPKS